MGGAKGGAEGNAAGPHGVRAQNRATPSSGIDRVRKAAQERKGERFTTLLHHIDAKLLHQAYHWLKREAAPGVDGMTWEAYGDGLEARLCDLETRIHRGSYRAQPSLRADIPKSDGRKRPLGIAALEDKIVQRAVVEEFSTPSTRRTSSASPTGSGLDGDSTMRWTRSRRASRARR